MKVLVVLSAALAMFAAGLTLGPGDGFAAKKKKTYTAEERKKLQAQAWKICRKGGYHVVQAEINWQTLKVTCWYR